MPQQVQAIPFFRLRQGPPYSIRRASQPEPGISTSALASAGNTWTDLYCGNGGSNLNAGTFQTTTPYYTSTAGNWTNVPNTFTPTDGSNPGAVINVGDFVSVFLNAATVTAFVAQVTAVQNAVNGVITVSNTAVIYGSTPSPGTGTVSLRAGGCWQGPNGATSFPMNAAPFNGVANCRINLRNDQTYSVTVGLSISGGFYQGYANAPGDDGIATIDFGSTANVTITYGGGRGFFNFLVKCSATTGTARGLTMQATVPTFRVTVTGFMGSGFYLWTSTNLMVECESYNNNRSNSVSEAGFYINVGTDNTFIRCIAIGNSGNNSDGFNLAGSNTSYNKLLQCISAFNGACGFRFLQNGSAITMQQCDAYKNGLHGIWNTTITTSPAIMFVENCNLVGNMGYGFFSSATTARLNGYLAGIGFGWNGLGSYNILGGLVLLNQPQGYPQGVSPYVSGDTGNFSLVNPNALGAGRGHFQQLATPSYQGTVGYPDLGAAQAPSGAVGGLNTSVFTLVDGYTGTPYYDLFQYGNNLTVTQQSGTLPPGLLLSQPGLNQWLLSGTPTTAGTYTAVMQTVDGSGAIGSFTLIVTIGTISSEVSYGFG